MIWQNIIQISDIIGKIIAIIDIIDSKTNNSNNRVEIRISDIIDFNKYN